MRCPKCHYLGFDPEPRCRNCGYDLEVADADLALHTADSGEDDVPDLTLHERRDKDEAPVTLELVHSGAAPKPTRARAKNLSRKTAAARSEEPPASSRPTLIEEPVDEMYEEPARQLEPEPFEPEPIVPEPVEPVRPSLSMRLDTELPDEYAPLSLSEPMRPPQRAPHTTTEMPLFVKGISDNEVPVVPPTRPPLSVRRAAPEPVKPAARPAERRLGPLDHDLLEDLKRVEREEIARERQQHARMLSEVATEVEEAEEAEEPVEPGRRLAAAAIDVGVLGGIAAFVFWATLRLCNVTVSDVGWSALVPFVIFIAVMDLSYLLMF